MNIVKVKNVVKTIERHPVEILGNDYRVKIEYRNVKVMELNVYEDTIKITLQNKFKGVNNEKMLDFAINKMYNAIAKVEIERAMEKTRLMLGFAPEDYKIESLNNEFYKCKNGVITISPDIVQYNKVIINTTILQEFCKIKYRVNSANYKKALQSGLVKYEKFKLGSLIYNSAKKVSA